MLNLVDRGFANCDGVSRRAFMRIGSLGLGGLTLPNLLRHEAHAAEQTGRRPRRP